LGTGIGDLFPLSLFVLTNGERIGVRGRSWARGKRPPLTLALSPLKQGEGTETED